MGLFNFSKRNQQTADSHQPNAGTTFVNQPTSINESKANIETPNAPMPNHINHGIDLIYTFLQADYESKGYADALVNPDDSYKADNIRLIKFDLQILIEKTDSYYDNLISDINMHIASRTRAGLVDLVQELETRKHLVESYKLKIKGISDTLDTETGMCQRIILSYQRGFMRGLSALTQTNIFNKKI
jgi:hypothetical protein